MLLFKTEHVAPILDGTKTQTRRLWPKGCRVKAGNVYQARTRMLDASSTFARLRILRVWRERLGDITEDDAHAEGYPSRDAYLDAFQDINRLWRASLWAFTLSSEVWAVEFAVERQSAAAEVAQP